MWPFPPSRRLPPSTAPVFFTNTLSGKKEVFAPRKPGHATMYSCGPTVYSKAHIGNLRPYVFSDTIARVLESADIKTNRVINITDVGHLTGDNEGDPNEGEDKMEVGAKREGLSAQAIADRYTKLFLDDIRKLGVDTDDILFPRATEYIKEQIALIQVLEKKGHTYRLPDGIYFDVATFPGYGKLGNIPFSVIKDGDAASLKNRIGFAGKSRIGEHGGKRNPADFALWKFSPAGTRRQQEWPSPWGRGFPGWHIECSAMSKALLGIEIDIHTGGMDHIPIHHNNEIAQSEGASGRTFVRYWIHNAFLTMEHEKVSKSLGNVVYLSDLVDRGYHPLALRYLFLQAHYRSPLSFSWEAIHAANEALQRLWKLTAQIKADAKGVPAHSTARERVIALLRDDLSTPQALALLWETLKDDQVSARVVWGVVEAADAVLGLSLTHPPLPDRGAIAQDVLALAQEREAARKAGDFARADELRIHILKRGYRVEDGLSGPVLSEDR